VFEFSCSQLKCGSQTKRAGFRSLMAERVMRLYEAQRSKSEVFPEACREPSSVGCVLSSVSELRSSSLRSVPLRSYRVCSVRVDVSHITPVSHLSPVSVSSVLEVLKSGSAHPRLFASCGDGPKVMLNPMTPNIKRAASARLFQRLGERLATLKSRSKPVGCVASVKVASVSASVASEFVSQCVKGTVGRVVLRRVPVELRLS
jgi:hypothetical protein